jgi:hypothetical protein
MYETAFYVNEVRNAGASWLVAWQTELVPMTGPAGGSPCPIPGVLRRLVVGGCCRRVGTAER